MFKTRLLSGIVLILVLLAVMLLGGPVLWTALTVVSLVGVFELYRVRKMECTTMAKIGYLGVLAWWVLAVKVFPPEAVSGDVLSLAVPVLVGILILLLMVFVFGYPRFHADQLFAAIFGVFYVAVMLSFLYLARECVPLGQWLVWLAVIASWGSDTCAYCVGMLLGKHKLAPVLSPKKSIEGAVGGVLGAALLGGVYGWVMCSITGEAQSFVGIFALIGGVGSMISQVGDLAASGIKRCYEIKDYGKLIPGHGGILDRFDSVIITAPIVYYLAVWMIRL